MRGPLWIFLLLAGLLIPVIVSAQTVTIDSSTQLIMGDDLLGETETVVAEYLRFGINPEKKSYSLTGYGRLWKDFGGAEGVRDDDLLGRLYYLYLDYMPTDSILFRLGRHYANMTAGSAVVDGLTAEFRNIGPVGASLTAGTDVRFGLDKDHSALGDYFLGVNLFLSEAKSARAEISYVRRYDEWDTAREHAGLNFRYFWRPITPYAELRYDWLSKTVDRAIAGVDIFPTNDLVIKAEYYHSYPTFDSTSIYSVFAVDEFREYLIKAEYSIADWSSVYASYSLQQYLNGDDEDADNYVFGARVRPLKGLSLNANIDHRDGWGGKLWGFELYGDYTQKRLTTSAGIQYDSYRRPDETSDGTARRYWLGGRWQLSKSMSVQARVEYDVNENFKDRTLGRLALNWSL